MPANAPDYLANADDALAQSDRFSDPDKARLAVAQAQVSAIEAVAAAINRLATVIANMDPEVKEARKRTRSPWGGNINRDKRL